MKNLLITLSIFCLPLIVKAQLSKGVSTFYGTIGINNDVTFLQANYGKFLNDQILFGSSINTSYSSSSFIDYLALGINPYVRYYFNPQQNNTFLYLQADYSYSTFLLDAEGNNTRLGLNLGLDHFIAPGVAFSTLGGINYEGTEGSYSRYLSLFLDLSAFIFPATTADKLHATIGQFQRGSLILGGSRAGLGRSLDRIDWNLSFHPRVGYFITNKLVLGARLGLSFQKIKTDLFGSFTSRRLNVSPFARYYLHYPKRFNPFVVAEFEYQSSTYTGFSIVDGNSSDVSLPKAGIGGDFFLTPNLAIEAILNVEYNTYNQTTRLVFKTGVQYFIH